MKIDLIKDAKKLIVLFLGYGFDKSSISHLELGDYGLLVVSDYSNLSFDREILANKDIYLISWSMGVWAANLALKNTPLKVARQNSIFIKIYKLNFSIFIKCKIFKFLLINT